MLSHALAVLLGLVLIRVSLSQTEDQPQSMGLLLHCRAAVTEVEVSEPTVVHAEGAQPPYYYPQTPLTRLSDGSLLLAGTGNQMLRSTDQGRTWVKLRSLAMVVPLLALQRTLRHGPGSGSVRPEILANGGR